MRRLTVFVLCVLLVLLAGACGKKEGKLVYMMWGDAEERVAVDAFLEKFVEKHPEVGMPKVIHTGSLQYWDKFQVMVAANETPDVFYMGPEEVRVYHKAGIMLDLTPLIERDKDEMQIDDFYEPVMRTYNIDGRQFGIAKDFATLVLYYNIDMFNERGVSLPNEDWTWDDMRNAARRLTVRQGDSVQVYGFIVETWATWLPAWVKSNGGRYVDESGKRWVLGVEPYLTRNAEAFQFLADMMTKERTAPDVSVKRQLGSQGTFASKKVAMCAYGRWAVLNFKEIKDFSWGIAEIPMAPRTMKRVSTMFSAAYAISKTSRYQEDAWKLVKFLTSPAGQVDVARSGQAIPSRKSVANSPDFLESEEVNRHQTARGNKIDHTPNLKAIEYSEPPLSHVNGLDIRAKLDQWFQPVFLGNETAAAKMKEKQDEFQKLLDKN